MRRTLLPPARARTAAFTALAWFGVVHWGRMVEPAQQGALLGCVFAAAAGGALLIAVARHGGRRARLVAPALVGVALLAVALAGAGVPASWFVPRAWDELAVALAQGAGELPTARIPYEGADAWTQSALMLGGGLLVGAAGLLAFAPRAAGAYGRPVAAALVLGAVYAVPAVQLEAEQPLLPGLAFALLLAAFLWLERVERPHAPLAAGLVGAAAVLALLAAPRLDAEAPLFDYEAFAQSLSPAAATRYDWSHRYGPLQWPREGREMLRIRARERSYWKATNLSAFDGRRWLAGRRTPRAAEGPISGAHPEWIQPVRVTVRALSSRQFVGAGTTLSISDAPRVPVEVAPGVFETADRPLRRGQSYAAVVYTPRPSARDVRAASAVYPPALRGQHLAMRLPEGPRAAATVVFPAWGESDGGASAAILSRSAYARTYALAQRLKEGAGTPDEYVRRVEEHLADGFAYSEAPSPGRVPLDAFLFEERAGYCQQFSGAMALLLRMGGVPARVAAGFAPGSRAGERSEFVVRDVDAHSWVEVYVPGHGWVTRDPTPAAAPARSQTADVAQDTGDAPASLGSAGRDDFRRAPETAAPAAGGPAGDDGASALPLAAGAAALLALLTALTLLALRRPAREPGEEAALAELRRALRRTGRPAPAGTTLDTLAHRLARTPAEGYLRALIAQRYGYGDAAGPTREQRAALRRELAAGLGAAGRLRAWWALPPRP